VKVIVKCFAVARDATGFAERTVDIAAGTTAGRLLEQIVTESPALAPHAARLALAINLEYADRSRELRDGDEMALIPPVSGG
jgi:molybdopterin converting factor subunit 1